MSAWHDRPPLPDPATAREQAAKALGFVERLTCIGDAIAANEVDLARVTFLARAVLSEAGIFPASRPELPEQLRDIDEHELATELDESMARRKSDRLVSRKAVSSRRSESESTERLAARDPLLDEHSRKARAARL